jgi:hypothetical protein
MGRWPKIDKLGAGTMADHEGERLVPAKCSGYWDAARGGLKQGEAAEGEKGRAQPGRSCDAPGSRSGWLPGMDARGDSGFLRWG